MHYGEVTKSREGWARSLLDEFKSNVEMLKSAVRGQQGPAPVYSSPQHGKHWRMCILFCCTHTHTKATSQWVFCPPVSHRDDVYEPLNQAAAEGVGLNEVQGSLEWISHTHLLAQCCWCLQSGTMVCSCVCAQLSAVMHTFCKANRVSIREHRWSASLFCQFSKYPVIRLYLQAG